MTEFSDLPLERARKIRATILQALAPTGTQVALSVATGISESAISRIKNDHLDHFCLLLAHAGLKVVSVDRICVNRQAYESMSYIASKAMADQDISKRLIWEDE